jgi:hypothetical protein
MNDWVLGEENYKEWQKLAHIVDLRRPCRSTGR